jgi:hypothetical protein
MLSTCTAQKSLARYAEEDFYVSSPHYDQFSVRSLDVFFGWAELFSR